MKSLMLTMVACVCFQANVFAQKNYSDNRQTGLAQVYVASTLPGIAVGAISGALCKSFDRACPEFWPLWWILEIIHRDSILSLMSSDMKNRDIEHHRSLLYLSAWVSSWVSFLHY